ncbi:MAG: tetratricopeptide repeat protein [Syntrophobacterales bacterium]
MSLISDSLKRVAEQRAGRKQPPVVPRRLAGQKGQDKKRRLLLLGLAILLAVTVVGAAVYGVIQWRAGKSEPAEAVTASPQKVIFDKITPPAKPLGSAADSEATPSHDGTVEQRTPVKPKVVQVAIQQEPVSTDETRQEKALSAEEGRVEPAATRADIEPRESSPKAEEQPRQPSSKIKVGLVGVKSAEQFEAQDEKVHTRVTRQAEAPPTDTTKTEEIVSADAPKKPEPVLIAGIKQGYPLNNKKTGLVDLHAETTGEAAHLYRQAVGYQRAMRWQEAINAYRKVLKYESMSAEVYNNIGVCYEKQGNLKMATKSYEKAISINPRFYRSYNNLGIIYYKLKDFNKARAAYEQALLLNPGNSQSEINLALIYERLRRNELARRTLEQVLVNDPKNAEAHYNLGRMLEGQGQHEEAIIHYRQFLASNPSVYPQLREKVQDRVRTLEGASNQ